MPHPKNSRRRRDDQSRSARLAEAMPHPKNSRRRRDDHFLTREDDGSVRLRFRILPEVASLIEEASGTKPPMRWIEDTIEAEARRQVREQREARRQQRPPRPPKP